MDLLNWVLASLDPDLLSDLEREWAEEKRYGSIEAFVENLPPKLKPDRQGRRLIEVPTRLLANIKSLTQLHSLTALKSVGKAMSYMTHYGLVKMLKEMDWKRLYRLNRALAMATPAIQEHFGTGALDILFTPIVHYSEPSRKTSVIPLYYDREGTIMNNIDTIMAVYGQLLPIDMAVSWAVAIALRDSHVAKKFGLSEAGRQIAETMKRQAIKNMEEKTCLLKTMAQLPEFMETIEEHDEKGLFKDYLRWL